MLAKNYVSDVISHANDVQADPRKKERLKQNECIACFYRGRIGGAAMTSRPCGLCGQEEMYGSTATDALCLACAQKHELCKHCGGDLHMRVRRKEWPSVEVGGQTNGIS
jgi:hypothetical protein